MTRARHIAFLAALGGALSGALSLAAHAEPARYRVEGDTIRTPLTREAGQADRGRAIVQSRTLGNCLLCHAAPIPEERFQGDVAPNLRGVGSRLTAAQIRLRVVDQTQVNPNSPMPAYHRVNGLTRVAPAFAGKPVLTAAEIEDVVAYLTGLRD